MRRPIINLRLLASFALLFLVSLTQAADYYWIGGSGNWNQISHWATSSGGTTVHSTIPSSADNVHFDANSTSSSTLNISINILAQCKNLDFRGTAVSRLTIGGISYSFRDINVHGDIYGSDKVDFGQNAEVNLASSDTQSIYSNSMEFSNLNIESMTVVNQMDNIQVYRLTVRGQYYTNNYDFNVSYLSVLSGGKMDFGSSESDLYSVSIYTGVGVVDSNFVYRMNGYSARIYLSSMTKNFPKVISTASTLSISSISTYAQISFSTIEATGSLEIGTRNLLSIDTLKCVGPTGGRNFDFSSSYSSVGIKVNDYIEISGSSCNSYNTLTGENLELNADTFFIENAIITDLTKTGTGVMMASNSILYGCTGVEAVSSAIKDYYWVGPGTNWSDPSNWSLTSGGSPLPSTACPPDPNTNVYFDANSFDSTNRYVYANGTSFCRKMDWTGATDTPYLFGNGLYVNHDLTLIDEMICNGSINLAGDSSNTTQFNGGQAYLRLNFGGDYTLLDSVNVQAIEVLYGSFNSNGQSIRTNSLLSEEEADSINLSGSKIYSAQVNIDAPLGSYRNYDGLELSNQYHSFYDGIFLLRNSNKSGKIKEIKLVSSQNRESDLTVDDTVSSVKTYGNVRFLDGMVVDSLQVFSNGFNQTIEFAYGKTCLVLDTALFQKAVGCEYHTLQSTSLADSASIKVMQDSFKIQGYNLNSITGIGPCIYIADSGGTENGQNTNWNISLKSIQAASDLYWVGGSGDWDDPYHWADSSGGIPNICNGIPGPNTNVHFDSNSNTSTTLFNVLVDEDASCKSFYESQNAGARIYFYDLPTFSVYKDFELLSNSSFNNSGNIEFKGAYDSCFIKSQTPFTYLRVYFYGNIDLKGDFESRYSYIYSDTFRSNSYAINSTYGLYIYAEDSSLINMDSSLINANSFRITKAIHGSFDGTTLIGSSFSSYSPIHFNGTVDFVGITNTLWSRGTTIKKATSNASGLNINSPCTINSAHLRGDIDFRADCSFDSLFLYANLGAGNYTINSGETVTVEDSLAIFTTGCNPAIILSNTSGSSASISLPSSTHFAGNNLDIQDITATGGATFSANANCEDLGGNTGWDFNGPNYNLDLKVDEFCIDSGFLNIITVNPSPYATSFWWQKTTWPYDTFNTNVDTIHAYKAAQYTFVSDYGGGCTIEDLVQVIYAFDAAGVAQTFYNLAEDSAWFNCSNWSSNLIPDSLSDVSIATGEKVYLGPGDTAHCKNLTINGELEIDGGVLKIYGNLSNPGTLLSNGSCIYFKGSLATTISGNNVNFDSLFVEKHDSGSIQTLSHQTIKSSLNIVKGMIFSSSAAHFTLNHGSTCSEGNPSSFVDGPLKKIGNDAFIFPIGRNGKWARLGVTAPSTTTNELTAVYFDQGHSDTTNYSSPLTKISGAEYWDLSVVGSVAIKVSLYFEDNQFSGIDSTNGTHLGVAHYGPSGWEDKGNTFDSMQGGKGYITSDVMYSFSPLTFGAKSGANPVPVEWLEAKAEWKDHSAEVSWSTATEINNSHFVIERSYDRENFEAIGEVNSNAPSGNSLSILNYQFNDQEAYYSNYPVVYYRIKQVDFDGSFDYSRTLALQKSGIPTFAVFPNPSEGVINVNLPDEGMTIEVWDIAGKMVDKIYVDDENTVIDLSLLRQGHYTLKAYNDFIRVQRSIVIVE